MTPDSPFSTQEQQMLNHMPTDGSAIGNKRLRTKLGWAEADYYEVRNGLVSRGLLVIGRGQGGSVSKVPLAPANDTGAVAQEKAVQEVVLRAKKERELYPPVKTVLESSWARDRGFKNFLVEITASAGAKSTGGTWTRPDLTLVAVSKHRLLPGPFLDVITFEVKPANDWDVTSVFEAAAHSRVATEAFLVIHTPSKSTTPDPERERVINECKRFGIGLMTFKTPTSYDDYEVVVDAERQNPAPADMNSFLVTQLSQQAQNQILDWL